ncbi:hypothetical protein BH24BAC1_BH24BAC1_41820 [soil metagenome]
MYKNILQSIAGIEIFPLISFAIFFGFFVCLLVYVVVADKKYLSQMSHLPLLSEDEGRVNDGQSREK